MAHYSRLCTIVIDVPEGDHDKELDFWEGAIGRRLTRNERFPEYHGVPLVDQAISLMVQRIEEGPGRVHLDFHTDDLEAEVARLERLGARRVQQAHRWWIMEDPAGLPFCVIPDPPGTLNDGNAQRWE
ncbi:VOC family protein [Nonomuraea sp. NPDC049480]|uniref:VOC family protein n=1 Tax=Nonomuraea sp. NPDC049480 TaxID=3364353 RepID=UPI0037BB2C54